jgi:CheY-like chemotaxis protein
MVVQRDLQGPRERAEPGFQVVLAEDDRELRSLLAQLLRDDGYAVIEVRDGNELAALLASGEARWRREEALVIADFIMPGQSGLAVLRSCRSLAWCPPFILITAFGEDEIGAEARRLGAVGVFDKTTGLEGLRSMIAALSCGLS